MSPLAYIKRVIAHPSFHNISFKQAEKMMETMDQGDVIIRPSSKGENHLTVTWKVNDGIYQHVDVREEGKENAFSLGATLWINTEVRALQSMPGKGLVGKKKYLRGRNRLAQPFCPCSCFQAG